MNNTNTLADWIAERAAILDRLNNARDRMTPAQIDTADNRGADLAGLILDARESATDQTGNASPFPDYLRDAEAAILSRIVADALARGFSVSVNDGMEWTVKRSRDAWEILSACATTDCDTLRFRDAGGASVGVVVLIYGNGFDLVHDYSDNATLADILAGASTLSELMQERA